CAKGYNSGWTYLDFW
nr:immunoglobulin heavy chain junction region [Macaca mulatta]MOV91510.1 immunoglobulin heavy chain junction region [Macaca mulatta]